MTNWLSLTFLCLYAVNAVNTITATRLAKRKYFAVTKSLIIPLLLTTYLLFLPEETRNLPYQKFAVLALICHWKGDVFLLFPKDKTKLYFYIGALSFFAGHIFLICWFAQPCWTHSVSLLVASSVIVLTLEVLLCCQMLKADKNLGLALVFYSFGLAVLFTIVVSAKNFFSALGVLFFWFSDYLIARRELKIGKPKEETCMGAYILAETLIFLGMYIAQR